MEGSWSDLVVAASEVRVCRVSEEELQGTKVRALQLHKLSSAHTTATITSNSHTVCPKSLVYLCKIRILPLNKIS